MQDKHERAGWTKVKRGPLPTTLRKWRLGRGLSQVQLATVIGVGQSQISNWERGISEPSLDQLRGLAATFNVSPGILLADVADENGRVHDG